eukprot:95957-Chlamydomonas_euryale.AAC.1
MQQRQPPWLSCARSGARPTGCVKWVHVGYKYVCMDLVWTRCDGAVWSVACGQTCTCACCTTEWPPYLSKRSLVHSFSGSSPHPAHRAHISTRARTQPLVPTPSCWCPHPAAGADTQPIVPTSRPRLSPPTPLVAAGASPPPPLLPKHGPLLPYHPT